MTGLLGFMGGKLANRLGIGDIDTIMAGGKAIATKEGEDKVKNVLRRAAEAALAEGAFEELPQSAQEQMAQNIATMSEQIPYYVLRQTVPPGVTGWAQVRQGYAVTYEEVLEKTCYDLYYIKNMSLVFDVRVMLETARVMLSLWGAR